MMDFVVWITCATSGCGYSPFPQEAGFNRRARQSHELFYCPAGHGNYYAQKSDVEQLQDRVAELKRELDDARFELSRAERSCPWIACGFVAAAGDRWDQRALWSHLRQVHGMPTLVEVERDVS